MAEKFVTMIKDGVKMPGVHPDAVAAHVAIGWAVVVDAEKSGKAEKSVEPENKAADNDTPKKPAGKGGRSKK